WSWAAPFCEKTRFGISGRASRGRGEERGGSPVFRERLLHARIHSPLRGGWRVPRPLASCRHHPTRFRVTVRGRVSANQAWETPARRCRAAKSSDHSPRSGAKFFFPTGVRR